MTGPDDIATRLRDWETLPLRDVGGLLAAARDTIIGLRAEVATLHRIADDAIDRADVHETRQP